MTKKDEKNLSWKLKDLPNASELKDLVDAKIITAEEAREMAFGSAESDKEVIKTLQEQITFLQDLVKELSRNRTTYLPTITREIHVNKPYFEKYWTTTNKTLGSVGYAVTTESLNTDMTGTTLKTGSFSQPSVMTMSVSQKSDLIS